MSDITWTDDMETHDRVFVHLSPEKEQKRLTQKEMRELAHAGDSITSWHQDLHRAENQKQEDLYTPGGAYDRAIERDNARAAAESWGPVNEQHTLDFVQDRLIFLLDMLRLANGDKSPCRSRELSVAITHIEDGMLRLEKAPR